MALGNAYFNVMPFASPGDLTRPDAPYNIAPLPFDVNNPFGAYGLPGKIAGGKFIPLSLVGDTAPFAFLYRPYPVRSPNASDPFFKAVPPTTGVANAMTLGYIGAMCNNGTAALGGTVYVRYANGTAGAPVGGVEATAIGGTNVALTGCSWANGMDGNNLSEIHVFTAN